MTEILLNCKDLIKIYPSPVEGLKFPALRGFDITIEKGEFVSMIGPSGAGKSTLLRLIGGFDIPSSGEIWFNNELINKYDEAELNIHRQKVGVMFQSPRDNLIWGLNAIDNVMLSMRFSGINNDNQKQRAKELLQNVGLKGKEKRKPNQLSGGEQQRLAIAVSLAINPLLLIADEPTGELDSVTTAQIIDYFKELNQNTGLTIFVATHDKRFSKITDKTYQIQDGKITTVHFRTKTDKKVDMRMEAVIVDSQGNLRLPQDVLEEFPDLKSVSVIVNNNHIKLIPIKEKKKQFD